MQGFYSLANPEEEQHPNDYFRSVGLSLLDSLSRFVGSTNLQFSGLLPPLVSDERESEQ